MERMSIVVLVCAALIAGCVPQHYTQHSRQRIARGDSLSAMKKQDVIALTTAGVGDSVIITMMNVSGSYFHLTTQDVIDLTNAGVSDKVINAMLAADESVDYAESSGDYYPRYYGYAYPYWDPWYYPSLYAGFSWRYYHPLYVHRFVRPHYSYFGHGGHGGGMRNPGGSRGFGGSRGGGGRHR